MSQIVIDGGYGGSFKNEASKDCLSPNQAPGWKHTKCTEQGSSVEEGECIRIQVSFADLRNAIFDKNEILIDEFESANLTRLRFIAEYIFLSPDVGADWVDGVCHDQIKCPLIPVKSEDFNFTKTLPNLLELASGVKSHYHHNRPDHVDVIEKLIESDRGSVDSFLDRCFLVTSDSEPKPTSYGGYMKMLQAWLMSPVSHFIEADSKFLLRSSIINSLPHLDKDSPEARGYLGFWSGLTFSEGAIHTTTSHLEEYAQVMLPQKPPSNLMEDVIFRVEMLFKNLRYMYSPELDKLRTSIDSVWGPFTFTFAHIAEVFYHINSVMDTGAGMLAFFEEKNAADLSSLSDFSTKYEDGIRKRTASMQHRGVGVGTRREEFRGMITGYFRTVDFIYGKYITEVFSAVVKNICLKVYDKLRDIEDVLLAFCYTLKSTDPWIFSALEKIISSFEKFEDEAANISGSKQSKFSYAMHNARFDLSFKDMTIVEACNYMSKLSCDIRNVKIRIRKDHSDLMKDLKGSLILITKCSGLLDFKYDILVFLYNKMLSNEAAIIANFIRDIYIQNRHEDIAGKCIDALDSLYGNIVLGLSIATRVAVNKFHESSEQSARREADAYSTGIPPVSGPSVGSGSDSQKGSDPVSPPIRSDSNLSRRPSEVQCALDAKNYLSDEARVSEKVQVDKASIDSKQEEREVKDTVEKDSFGGLQSKIEIHSRVSDRPADRELTRSSPELAESPSGRVSSSNDPEKELRSSIVDILSKEKSAITCTITPDGLSYDVDNPIFTKITDHISSGEGETPSSDRGSIIRHRAKEPSYPASDDPIAPPLSQSNPSIERPISKSVPEDLHSTEMAHVQALFGQCKQENTMRIELSLSSDCCEVYQLPKTPTLTPNIDDLIKELITRDSSAARMAPKANVTTAKIHPAPSSPIQAVTTTPWVEEISQISCPRCSDYDRLRLQNKIMSEKIQELMSNIIDLETTIKMNSKLDPL